MRETVKATIDSAGNVVLKEKVRLSGKHNALVTILDEATEGTQGFELIGSLEIIGDIEKGSSEITEMFRRSIERSAKELDR